MLFWMGVLFRDGPPIVGHVLDSRLQTSGMTEGRLAGMTEGRLAGMTEGRAWPAVGSWGRLAWPRETRPYGDVAGLSSRMMAWLVKEG